MKKWTALILVLVMCLSLCACGTPQSDAAKKADELISAIGEVTLDSESAIVAAEEAVAALEDADKDSLKGLSTLEQARSDYDALVVKEKVSAAEDAIAAIESAGDDKAAAIAKASEAIEALSEEEAAQVSNMADYESAKEAMTAEMSEKATTLLSAMDSDEDPFNGVTFYYPAGWSWYDENTWVADQRSFILPYMGIDENNNVWLDVVYNYTGDDWVFWTSLTILADGEKFTQSYSSSQMVHDNSGGKVWEYIDDFPDAAGIDMLRAIANANEVLVRFQGRDYAVDITLSDTDKAAIRQTLEVFDALIAAGYHDAT